MKGYTVVDAATVLSTHLTELLKSNTAELLSYAEVQKLIKDLPKDRASWSRTSCRRKSPSPASSACCNSPRRAGVGPRFRDHPGRHRGCTGVHPQSHNHRRTRPRAALPPDLRPTQDAPGYLPLIALSAKWEQNFAELFSARATNAPLQCSPRASRSSLPWCESVSRMPPARARRRCPSPRPVSGRSCAASPSASAPRPAVLSQSEIHPRAGRRRSAASDPTRRTVPRSCWAQASQTRSDGKTKAPGSRPIKGS